MDEREQLAELELEMGRLRALRSQRIAAAQAAVARANAEFDRDAVPLNRKIEELRKSVDSPTSKPVTARRKRVVPQTHDPEWSQADIDHYYELAYRGR